MKTVKPIHQNVKFIPGKRYIINKNTGVIFPYCDAFAVNPDNTEYFPTYNVVENKGEVVEDVQPETGTTVEPVVIETVTIDVNAKDLTPIEKARIAKANKAAEKAAKEG